MEVTLLEGLAVALYTRLELDPSRPVSTFTLARKLLGVPVQRPKHMVGAPAMTGIANDQRYIAVKASVPIAYARWLCGHELAHVLLKEEGYVGDDVEACCDFLGAALMAPRPAAIALQRTFGFDPRAIASEVIATETWAALRVGEVLRLPLAVVATIIRVRGPEEFAWPSELTLRSWARRPPRGLAKTRLTDDPRRVVLVAEELDLAG